MAGMAGSGGPGYLRNSEKYEKVPGLRGVGARYAHGVAGDDKRTQGVPGGESWDGVRVIPFHNQLQVESCYA